MNRYIAIALFAAAIALAEAAAEMLFRVTGSGLSIFDTNGPGQVTLLAIPLAMIPLFVRHIAGGSALAFLRRYWRMRGRAFLGFLSQWLLAAIGLLIVYWVLWRVGGISFNHDSIAAIDARVIGLTLVALLVVFVLATTEEFIFRVFLMRYLMWDGSRLAMVTAVISASLIFAVLHNLTAPAAWLTASDFPLFIGLFLLGMLLCITYIATGSITCSIGVHSGMLGSKVLIRETDLLTYDSNLLQMSIPGDIRTSPYIWALWALMAVVMILIRRHLRRDFAIETDLHEQARDDLA